LKKEYSNIVYPTDFFELTTKLYEAIQVM